MMKTPALLDDRAFEHSVPQIRADVLVRHYENEIVAWAPTALRPIHLDPVSALVFQLLDGEATVGELIADVHDVIGIPAAIARSQLRRAVTLFDNAALLTNSVASEPLDVGLDLFPAPPNP